MTVCEYTQQKKQKEIKQQQKKIHTRWVTVVILAELKPYSTSLRMTEWKLTKQNHSGQLTNVLS